MSRQTINLPFAPRKWQVPLLDCASRNVVAVVHRRAGKTTLYQWLGLRAAASTSRLHLSPHRFTKLELKGELKKNPPRVVHVLPSAVMWQRTGMWDSLVRTASHFPGAVVAKVDRCIRLPNGGTYQTGGMDEPDRWRGGYADLVIEDEADDVMASGIDMAVVPMLGDYQGQRIKIGTPKGNGRLLEAYEKAGGNPDSSRFLLGWQQTGVFTPEQIDEFRRQMGPEEFEQEFACSFQSPNLGSYYGKWLDAALASERIGRVTYDPMLPVYTAWDLGVDDSTAIWFFQRSPGGEWRWLEYHEDNGVGFDEYVRLLNSKPYNYGKHYLPHDVEVREMSANGKSRRQVLMGLGVKPIQVVPAANPADRIAQARMILPRSFFDAKGCAKGIEMLRLYRRQWNDKMGVWREEPLHDKASHAADAFGTGVQGSKTPDETKPVQPFARHPVPAAAGDWMGL